MVTDVYKAKKHVCFLIALVQEYRQHVLISQGGIVLSVITLKFSQTPSEASHEKELGKPEIVETAQNKCATKG